MGVRTESPLSSALAAAASSALPVNVSETAKQPPGLTIRKKGDTVIRPKS